MMTVSLPTFHANGKFVEVLVSRGVRLLIVGGLAVKYYCPERQANDLDLLIEPTAIAGREVFNALPAFNEMPAFQPEDFASPNRHLSQKRALYLDLLTPHSSDDFEQFWSRCNLARLDGVSERIHVISLPDLLMLKQRAAADRGDVKDHRDVALLQAAV